MEKQIVEIRGVRIGEGIPKICVPLTDTTIEELLKSADAVVKSGLADLVEWRLDWFLAAKESNLLPYAIKKLRSRLGEL
ncbi:MAG: type I 3-dehydroquinate dehydratase, partial [Lachnospiraceae bacterium]|nr:type I 3-dehydroquinate dehydratase [Lachnospiraceae bacterium]